MAGEEFLINMWLEMGTDSVSKRCEIVEKLEKFLDVPAGEHFKFDGPDGADIYFNSDEFYRAEDIKAYMQAYIDSGDVLAYEYNVDEIEYTNTEHLYIGG